MKRKLLSFIFAVVLITAVTACFGRNASTENQGGSQSTSPTSAADSSVPTASEAPQTAFREEILVDDENCTFKITAVNEDSLWGYTLKAFLENKTDKELMFAFENTSVNGFMCDPFWAQTITSGMKAYEDISFASSDFDRNGIDTVTEIEFTLKIYDNNDWTAEPLIYDTFVIHPMGQESVQPYVRTPVEGETVLFENDSCAMIVTGFNPDDTLGYAVQVYLENKTDRTLMFSIDGAAVNGYMCDPFWAESVAPGKRSNSEILWLSSELDESGITEVTSLTLPIRVYDSNDWDAENLVNDTFTLNP